MSPTFEKFNITGKRALVTGGATGLGFHMAKALAEAGATVMICGRRESVLREAVAQLNAECETEGVSYSTVDLNNRTSIRQLSAHAIAAFGGIDIFVGNAGQDLLQQVADITDGAIDQLMQVNVSANVELVRAFLPGMRANRWGRILFSSSATTVVTSPHEGIGMYTATKGALNAFTRTLAAEVGHDNITANSLVLGFFYTDMIRNTVDLFRRTKGEEAAKLFLQEFVGVTALGRAGNLEELEGLVQLLASDAGSYITGTNLVIDGGMSIMLRPNGVVA